MSDPNNPKTMRQVQVDIRPFFYVPIDVLRGAVAHTEWSPSGAKAVDEIMRIVADRLLQSPKDFISMSDEISERSRVGLSQRICALLEMADELSQMQGASK